MKHFKYPHTDLLLRKAQVTEKLEKSLEEKRQLEERLKALNDDIQYSSDDVTEVDQGFEDFQSQVIIQENDVKNQIYEAMIKSQNEKISNYGITGPTQMGKTAYFLSGAKKCYDKNLNTFQKTKKNLSRLFVMSCANQVSQAKQLMTRTGSNGLQHFYIGNLTKKNFKNEAEKLIKFMESGRSYVLVLLDNEIQVKKLDEFLKYILVDKKFNMKRYVFLHDEGDLVNKADDVKNIITSAAKSHREWVHLIEHLKIECRWIKRFWISATLESCSYLHEITFNKIFVIPTSPRYVSVTEHQTWNGESYELLSRELSRIKNNNKGEVILFCNDRKNEDQHKTAKEISNFDCVVVTYNSEGFKAYNMGNPYELPTCKEISAVLSVLKAQPLPVVIVGYDLLNRGLSFVGKDADKPLTATVMFYNSPSPHIIGLTQRIGRICGTSRPDLPVRKIYCSDKIYENYVGYLKSQYDSYAVMYDNNNQNLTMDQILELVNTTPATLKYERPTLPKTNKQFSRARKTNPVICSEESLSEDDNNDEKMKKLIKNWVKNKTTSKISKLFYKMVQNNYESTYEEVDSIYKNSGALHTLTEKTSSRNVWYMIFAKDNKKYYIKKEARDYYESLLK